MTTWKNSLDASFVRENAARNPRVKYYVPGTPIALGIALLFGVACAAKGYADGYANGRATGWADCNPTRQFVAGFALSLLYVGYSALSPAPAPPPARMSDIALETDHYQEGYNAGYESGWSSRRLINAIGGAASWLVILAIISGA